MLQRCFPRNSASTICRSGRWMRSTGRALSCYDHHLLVIDWDAALLIDEPKNFDKPVAVTPSSHSMIVP
jgi:hypothetical protein